MMVKTEITKIVKISIEKDENADKIMKNQKDKPVDTASALNRGEDNSILNRIDKCYKTSLS